MRPSSSPSRRDDPRGLPVYACKILAVECLETSKYPRIGSLDRGGFPPKRTRGWRWPLRPPFRFLGSAPGRRRPVTSDARTRQREGRRPGRPKGRSPAPDLGAHGTVDSSRGRFVCATKSKASRIPVPTTSGNSVHLIHCIRTVLVRRRPPSSHRFQLGSYRRSASNRGCGSDPCGVARTTGYFVISSLPTVRRGRYRNLPRVESGTCSNGIRDSHRNTPRSPREKRLAGRTLRIAVGDGGCEQSSVATASDSCTRRGDSDSVSDRSVVDTVAEPTSGRTISTASTRRLPPVGG